VSDNGFGRSGEAPQLEMGKRLVSPGEIGTEQQVEIVVGDGSYRSQALAKLLIRRTVKLFRLKDFVRDYAVEALYDSDIVAQRFSRAAV
jgi:hypothetical protein